MFTNWPPTSKYPKTPSAASLASVICQPFFPTNPLPTRHLTKGGSILDTAVSKPTVVYCWHGDNQVRKRCALREDRRTKTPVSFRGCVDIDLRFLQSVTRGSRCRMDDPISDGLNAAGDLLNTEPVKNLLSPVTKEVGLRLCHLSQK